MAKLRICRIDDREAERSLEVAAGKVEGGGSISESHTILGRAGRGEGRNGRRGGGGGRGQAQGGASGGSIGE